MYIRAAHLKHASPIQLIQYIVSGAYERCEVARRSVQQRIIVRNGIVKST